MPKALQPHSSLYHPIHNYDWPFTFLSTAQCSSLRKRRQIYLPSCVKHESCSCTVSFNWACSAHKDMRLWIASVEENWKASDPSSSSSDLIPLLEQNKKTQTALTSILMQQATGLMDGAAVHTESSKLQLGVTALSLVDITHELEYPCMRTM